MNISKLPKTMDEERPASGYPIQHGLLYDVLCLFFDILIQDPFVGQGPDQ